MKLNYFAFQSFDYEVADVGYSRNVPCAQHSISTFLFEMRIKNTLMNSFTGIRYLNISNEENTYCCCRLELSNSNTEMIWI